MKHTNQLIHETSPYLLQHAHNPVDWYPWGREALQKAKKEDKMLLISVGYAACHWCHVMEHESFEDEQVARLMNEHFVSIKVDREERPDVDAIYINAAQLVSGNAGWPLNALALPDGRPFFAATYFPKDRWITLLEYFVNEYKNNKHGLAEQAEHLTHGIAGLDKIPFVEQPREIEKKYFKIISDKILLHVDRNDGGLSTEMKFPRPSVWEWLLEYYYYTGDKSSAGVTFLTLDKMMHGGIYDQLGGGFSRYATDPLWHVPHFEKMLFDNAQLLSLYSHAWQTKANAAYKRVVEETIGYLKREMLSPEKGFYSSLDADSDGEEGKYYVWYHQEIIDVLGEKEAAIFCRYYGVTEEGNWEYGKNILDINQQLYGAVETADHPYKLIEESRKKLLAYREKRIKPRLDDKIITAWNALTSQGLIDAGKSFQKEEWHHLAKENIDFLTEKMWDKKERILYRNYQRNRPATYGFLDDYAFLIRAMIALYQISFDVKYLHQALGLVEITSDYFYNAENKMFFYNDQRFNQLISRPIEADDNVIPSSNSVMAENLLLLGTLLDKNALVEQGKVMVGNMLQSIIEEPVYMTHWARVLHLLGHGIREIAIIGDRNEEIAKEMNRSFIPNALYCGSKKEENLPLLSYKFRPGQTTIYVCRNKVCQSPVVAPSEALLLLKNNNI